MRTPRSTRYLAGLSPDRCFGTSRPSPQPLLSPASREIIEAACPFTKTWSDADALNAYMVHTRRVVEELHADIEELKRGKQ